MLHRRTARAQEQAQLAKMGEQIEGPGQDWEEETLASEEEGLVFFDGVHDLSIPRAGKAAVLCCAVLCWLPRTSTSTLYAIVLWLADTSAWPLQLWMPTVLSRFISQLPLAMGYFCRIKYKHD